MYSLITLLEKNSKILEIGTGSCFVIEHEFPSKEKCLFGVTTRHEVERLEEEYSKNCQTHCLKRIKNKKNSYNIIWETTFHPTEDLALLLLGTYKKEEFKDITMIKNLNDVDLNVQTNDYLTIIGNRGIKTAKVISPILLKENIHITGFSNVKYGTEFIAALIEDFKLPNDTDKDLYGYSGSLVLKDKKIVGVLSAGSNNSNGVVAFITPVKFIKDFFI